MKLGPFWRRRYTQVHEIARNLAPYLDYAVWKIISFPRSKKIPKGKLKKILFVLVNETQGNVGGDFCLLGVINYMKKIYPELDITILTDSSTGKRFGTVKGIKIKEYDAEKKLEDIKKEKFEAAVFINLTEGLKVEDFSFIPYRLYPFIPSVRTALSLKNKKFTTNRVFIAPGTHMVDIIYKVFCDLGYESSKKDILFYYSGQDKNSAEKKIKALKIEKYIVVHPGGKFVVETIKKGKCAPHLWNLERYSKVAEYLAEKGYSVLISGTKEEEYLAEKILKNCKHKDKIKIICGKFSIREMAYVLEKAKLLFGTDTSIMHIGYQVKVPIVELMGPSCVELVAVWPINSERHRILVDKGPCYRSMKKAECPEDIPCLDGITADDAISAIEDLLRKG